MAVFVCHVNAYWIVPGDLPLKMPQLMQAGAHGVDLFVVISGFCLALPFFRGRGLGVREFYGRRAFRLLGPYYAALGFAAVLAMIPSTSDRVVARPATAGDVGFHFATIQTWVPGESGSINGSFWSIALEAHLYLLFPVLIGLVVRYGAARITVGAAAVSVIWGLLPAVWVLSSAEVLPARLVQFAVGVWCAEMFVRERVPPRRLLVAGLFGGGLVAFGLSTTNVTFATHVLWSVPCGSLVLLLIGRRPSRWETGPLASFGAISFSFYLLHQPLLLLTSAAARGATSTPIALLLLGVTGGFLIVLIPSIVFHLGVERPCHQMGRRLFPTRRVEPAPAA